jgi:hypothetical protein
MILFICEYISKNMHKKWNLLLFRGYVVLPTVQEFGMSRYIRFFSKIQKRFRRNIFQIEI